MTSAAGSDQQGEEAHGEQGPHTWLVVTEADGAVYAQCLVCGRRDSGDAWVQQQHIDDPS